jgi:hypothetical protein
MIPEDTPAGMDNCGIVSVATLAGTSYRDAESVFISLCGRRNFTSVWQRLDALAHMGVRVEEEMHYRVKPTLRHWLTTTYDPSCNYSVTITGHVVTIKDDLMLDQVFREGIAPTRSLYNRKRVQSYIKLRRT